MSVYRARSMCPSCSTEDEVWIYKGKIQPVNTIYCTKCSGL
jgi:Zn ribbon nucleic-acid-binding protein